MQQIPAAAIFVSLCVSIFLDFLTPKRKYFLNKGVEVQLENIIKCNIHGKMKKSPFSTPRGSGNGSRQGFGWNSNERRNNRGYKQRNNSFETFPSNSSQEVNSDFIPFTSSPGYHDRGRDKNFYGRGGRGNRGFSGSPGYHNNDNSPRGKFNYSPYNSRGRRNFSKTSHRDVPIGQYIDLRNVLEDPWKNLVDDADKSINQSMQEENESVVSINPELFNESVEMKSLEESEDLSEKFKDSND